MAIRLPGIPTNRDIIEIILRNSLISESRIDLTSTPNQIAIKPESGYENAGETVHFVFDE
jgi:hypothetical protein